jgi:hypothetical protein
MKDIKGGQYRKKPAKKDEHEEKYFALGKQAAKVESDKKENEQLAQMNMIQSLMLADKTIQLKQMLAEIELKQKMLDEQMAAMMAPPPLPGMPIPGGDPMGGMPPGDPMMGGMPPDAMGGGMPPGDPMMGGMPPQGGPTPGIDMGMTMPM